MTTEWNLATRAAGRNSTFETSIWTNLLKLFQLHPDPVYFGDGSPDRSAMPIDRLRHGSYQAWEEAPTALNYGDQQGYEPLRQLIVERMRPLGVETSADRIVVTSGSTQALDLACRVFLDPGDVVVTENPTFLGATELFRAYEARLVTVETDERGMDIDQLEHVLASEPNAKVIYTIPTFHNPTGSTMPLERRRRLIEIARRHNVAILEDDPYSELRYDGEPVTPLAGLDPNVIYMGTFSKTIAPGIRTGWTIAPPDITRLIVANREVADISNDRITMRTVYHTAQDFLTTHVAGTLDTYRARRDTMLSALAATMPDSVTWSSPNGGFFVWITLPESIDATALAETAATNGVIYFPGQWFYPRADNTNSLRLSFSTVPEDRIRLGVERLAITVRQAMSSTGDTN